MTRIISITSGRPQVGKTTVSLNLAAQLAALGQRVCLFDADSGGNDLASQLRVRPQACLSDFIDGKAGKEGLCQRSEEGFDWLAAGTDLATLSPGQVQRVADALATLRDYDFILIDVSSSLNANLLGLSLASTELLVLIDTDARTLSESYALLKVLFSEAYEGQISILVNKAENHANGRHSYSKFKEVAGFYLDMDLPLAGMIASDPVIETAETAGSLLAQGLVSSGYSDIEALAHRVHAAGTAPISIDRFCDAYRQAAGQSPEDTYDYGVQPVSWRASGNAADLTEQLDALSSQVDALINEINSLRDGNDSSSAALLEIQQPEAPSGEHERCTETCIAAMASYTETCTVDGETFSVYQIAQPDGGLQRFAFHSLDDDIREPEPQSRSS